MFHVFPFIVASHFSPCGWKPDVVPLCSWQNDVFVVAEPGELAEKFLQNVKFSLLSTMRSHRRKGASLLASISCISELVAYKPYFHIGGIVHRYLGRQTLVYLLLLVLLYNFLNQISISL